MLTTVPATAKTGEVWCLPHPEFPAGPVHNEGVGVTPVREVRQAEGPLGQTQVGLNDGLSGLVKHGAGKQGTQIN